MGAGAVEGQLGKAPRQGLGLLQQARQALDGGGLVGLGRNQREQQSGCEQQTNQLHVALGANQSRIGGGASTSREPLVFMEVTTPAISMASIIRAARL